MRHAEETAWKPCTVVDIEIDEASHNGDIYARIPCVAIPGMRAGPCPFGTFSAQLTPKTARCTGIAQSYAALLIEIRPRGCYLMQECRARKARP